MSIRALFIRISNVNGYAPALISLVTAMALHVVWIQFFPPRSYLISFTYLVAILAAGWCGYGPGLLVTALSVFVIPYLIIPGFTIKTIQPGGVVLLGLISLIVSRTAKSRREAEQRLLDQNEALDKSVKQRTVELDHTNQILQERIAELETLYGELFVGLGFLDINLRFVRVNQQLAAMHGSKASAHEGCALREILPPALADIVEPRFRKVLETGEPVLDFEFAYAPGPSGDKIWMMGCAPVRSADRLRGIQVVMQDITDRKRSERALREAHAELQGSEERFRSLVNAMSQLAWMADSDGSIFWYNDRWYQYTGTTFEQMRGWGWQSVHDPTILPQVNECWKASIASGTAFEMEFPLKGADHRFRWFLTRIIPMRNSSGEIVRWFGTNTDIHDVREAREALRESEARFRSMADSAPVMIWLAGTDQRLVWLNRPWLSFSGQSLEDELACGAWSGRVHPDDRDACMASFGSKFQACQPFVLEYRRRRADGQWRWVLDNGVPRVDGQGAFLGYIGSCIEIHDRKEMEQNLRRANADLEQFAYSASHDLQEPLRTVSIYSELMGLRYGDRFDGEGLEFLGNVTTAASRMEMLVRDLLAYTQTANLEPSSCELTEANAALDLALYNLAASIHRSSAVITRGNLPAVRVQNVHLQQLFQNLISNAIKYRGDAPPLIRVDAVQRENHWEFSVTDNGIGIDPAYKERIFGIFKRLHTADKYSGTGIGLAICRRTVEHYGGRIWVESGSGNGATFRFTIPV
jgi:PAS domain S-box-containing protein